MNVLMVTSECAPFIKTGGLADVAGALPGALAPLGIDLRTMLPAYPALMPLVARGTEVASFGDLPGGPGRVVQVEAEGLTLLLLDAPQLFDRRGGPYSHEGGHDWNDNHRRFASLAQAAARISFDGLADWKPDIVHAHDWQAGLTPVYLKQPGVPAPRSVITIHNIAFQGRFAAHEGQQLGLRWDWFTPDGFEYHGDISFLKAGLVYADRITTVSPTYAREILTPRFGMGLEGVLSARQSVLSGILNGIDTDVWNPATDPALARNYDADSLADLDTYVVQDFRPDSLVVVGFQLGAVDAQQATGTFLEAGDYFLLVVDFLGVPTEYVLRSEIVDPAPGPAGVESASRGFDRERQNARIGRALANRNKTRDH